MSFFLSAYQKDSCKVPNRSIDYLRVFIYFYRIERDLPKFKAISDLVTFHQNNLIELPIKDIGTVGLKFLDKAIMEIFNYCYSS